MFCTYCGKSVNKDAKFCNHCGKSVHDNSSAPIRSNKIHSSNDIFAGILLAIFTVAGGVWRIIWIILVLIGIWVFITHLGSIDPSTAPISSLQSMSCKNFLTLSENDRLEVGNRLYTAKYNEVNSMAGASTMLDFEEICNNQPDTTLGQLNY